MPELIWIPLLVVLAWAVATSLGWWHSARQASRARAEARRLAQLVERHLQRPEVFGHEVRTPLALVLGAAELLQDEAPGPLTPMQREFVSTITTNTRQVIGMAEDLLVEAQSQSKLFELRPERLELRSLVRQTVRETRRIHPSPITLVSAGPPIMVTADPDLLRQALWNLVNNAVRHAGESVEVIVEVMAGDGEAIVQVSDDGAGLTPAERADLFTPYVVGTTRRPGAGLGMMITQQIIRQHGGRILVDSQLGSGTSFLLAIPLEASMAVSQSP